jgi:hypothetical protein
LPQKGGQDATPKKLPETDAIFEHLKEVNARADAQEGSLRLSMDTKAVVKVGPFARGGKSRILTKAADHDFKAQDTVTPVGIFLPASDELFLLRDSLANLPRIRDDEHAEKRANTRSGQR